MRRKFHRVFHRQACAPFRTRSRRLRIENAVPGKVGGAVGAMGPSQPPKSPAAVQPIPVWILRGHGGPGPSAEVAADGSK